VDYQEDLRAHAVQRVSELVIIRLAGTMVRLQRISDDGIWRQLGHLIGRVLDTKDRCRLHNRQLSDMDSTLLLPIFCFTVCANDSDRM
jgi:hypothetical protein